jgi:uncharacterized membrane protein
MRHTATRPDLTKWLRLSQIIFLHNLVSIISVIFAMRQDLLSNFWFVHLLSVFSIRRFEKARISIALPEIRAAAYILP